MLKYIKKSASMKKTVKMNQNYQNQVQVKQKKKWPIKKSFLQLRLLGHGFYLAWRRKFPASVVHCLQEELSNTAMVPAKISRHFPTYYSHLSNKKIIASNDFWIHKTNNVKLLRRT
jgi:hypothetical protein